MVHALMPETLARWPSLYATWPETSELCRANGKGGARGYSPGVLRLLVPCKSISSITGPSELLDSIRRGIWSAISFSRGIATITGAFPNGLE